VALAEAVGSEALELAEDFFRNTDLDAVGVFDILNGNHWAAL
jgi:hypothetical protein